MSKCDKKGKRWHWTMYKKVRGSANPAWEQKVLQCLLPSTWAEERAPRMGPRNYLATKVSHPHQPLFWSWHLFCLPWIATDLQVRKLWVCHVNIGSDILLYSLIIINTFPIKINSHGHCKCLQILLMRKSCLRYSVKQPNVVWVFLSSVKYTLC